MSHDLLYERVQARISLQMIQLLTKFDLWIDVQTIMALGNRNDVPIDSLEAFRFLLALFLERNGVPEDLSIWNNFISLDTIF